MKFANLQRVRNVFNALINFIYLVKKFATIKNVNKFYLFFRNLSIYKINVQMILKLLFININPS